MNLLDDEQSWELLCLNAFSDDDTMHCPPEFEKCAREVVEKCGGLGLAIVAAGGLLSKSRNIPEYWERVAQDLAKVIQLIDFTTERAKKMAIGDQPSSSFSRHTMGIRRKIVGLEKDMELLKGRLTGEPSELEVLPIQGMAGIGKTTLATALYNHYDSSNDSNDRKRFDIRGWVTVSQEYRVRDIFVGLLSSMGKLYDKIDQESDEQLANEVSKSLRGNRYLVVVDDMWDTKVWDRMKNYFPNDKNRSRILLTTRHSEVAVYVSTNRAPHKMSLLNNEQSWELLSQNAFSDGQCPPKLENIGRKVAEKCGGLGLSIVVVGGLLSKSNNELAYWESVAEDITLAMKRNEKEPWVEILSLSYNHLPSRSKGCFLYFGAFPEDFEMPISKLIKLWIAEGFLAPPAPSKTLEEAAQDLLEDLIDRNLAFVRKWSSIGTIRTCKIHDLIRDLCLKESKEEKFYHIIDRYVREFPKGTESQRRVTVHKNILMCMPDMKKLSRSINLARSLVYAGPHHHHPIPVFLSFELLRVLDALTIYLLEFPSEIVELIHLRYLSLTYNRKIPSSISKLQNLLTLVIRHYPKIIFTGISVLPIEIWSMPKLRHLHFVESALPDLSGVEIHGRSNFVFLENLQSLSNVDASCCTREILCHAPNLKRLGIWMEAPDALPYFCLDELEHLETLKFVVLNPVPGCKVNFPPELAFPSKLKKLTLSGCGLPWEDIAILGELEHLEVLKLREFAFQGPMWEPSEDEFSHLKFLLLEAMDLVHFIVDDTHFPSLESLIFKHCYELNEIVPEIGDKPTLKLIEVVDCPSATNSAKGIQKKQKENGKKDFQVRIYSSWE